MKMKKENTFQERVLAFLKRTKKKNKKYSLILLLLVITSLLLFIWFERTGTTENVYVRENQKLTMTLVGDIMMGRHVENIVQQNGEAYIFRYVKPYLEDADYVSGNFEHPVLLEEEDNYVKAEKYIHLRTNKEVAQATKEAGFSVMNIANNHLMDYGAKGLEDTVKAFKEIGLDYVGAGEDLQQAKNTVYKEVNGVRIATLGFTDAYVKGFVATKEDPGVLSMNPELLFEQIGLAKSNTNGNADLVVVHAHWGQEYDDEPSPRQQALGRAMIEAGADIIIGHHPHVLQSFEVYKDGIIFYSLGNFVFDQGWTRTKDSALVQYHLNEEGNAIVDIVPLQIKEGTPRKTSNWLDKKRIFRQLTKDTPKDNAWEEVNGQLEVKLNHQYVIEEMKNRVNKR
jgi:gamma-polyglutamate biosynthesis protein CapA